MKIKPLNDRVLVKRMEEVQVTKGGILIPDTAAKSSIEGKSSPSAWQMSDGLAHGSPTQRRRLSSWQHAGTETRQKAKNSDDAKKTSWPSSTTNRRSSQQLTEFVYSALILRRTVIMSAKEIKYDIKAWSPCPGFNALADAARSPWVPKAERHSGKPFGAPAITKTASL
jgi:hypothetical protein